MKDFIKLTNVSPDFKDQQLVLKKDIIVSVFTGTLDAEEGAEEKTQVTVVYAPPHGNWQVKESVEEIYQLLIE